MSTLYLYNSLTKRVEEFIPSNPPTVSMYTCGFTVYDRTHIGHIKKYVGDDTLRRILIFNGYEVKHVQNVTDVGHLDSDADSGEDKMEKGAKKHGLTVFEVAKKFEDEFYGVMDQMNVLRPTIVQRAASNEAIKKQQEMIQILLDKGFAYIKERAIYFDISKLDSYNPFSKLNALEKQQTGAREEVEVDRDKKNPSDFVLWFFRKGKFSNHAMHWDSPWGDGFPGWHIECTAISIGNLGEHIDIHTGGIEHKEVHHPNEIAQNFGLVGKDVVKYWLHHNFLTVDGKKMSKSLGNFYTLDDVRARKFDPMVLRYFVLTANYRSQINFTWEALDGIDTAYNRLTTYIARFLDLKEVAKGKDGLIDLSAKSKYINNFKEVINNDLNTPEGLALLWNLMHEKDINPATKLEIVTEFDKVLGLNLIENAKKSNLDRSSRNIEIDPAIKTLVDKRDRARKDKNFNLADDLKNKISLLGYVIEDSLSGTVVKKKLDS